MCKNYVRNACKNKEDGIMCKKCVRSACMYKENRIICKKLEMMNLFKDKFICSDWKCCI